MWGIIDGSKSFYLFSLFIHYSCCPFVKVCKRTASPLSPHEDTLRAVMKDARRELCSIRPGLVNHRKARLSARELERLKNMVRSLRNEYCQKCFSCLPLERNCNSGIVCRDCVISRHYISQHTVVKTLNCAAWYPMFAAGLAGGPSLPLEHICFEGGCQIDPTAAQLPMFVQLLNMSWGSAPRPTELLMVTGKQKFIHTQKHIAPGHPDQSLLPQTCTVCIQQVLHRW